MKSYEDFMNCYRNKDIKKMISQGFNIIKYGNSVPTKKQIISYRISELTIYGYSEVYQIYTTTKSAVKTYRFLLACQKFNLHPWIFIGRPEAIKNLASLLD